MGEKERSRGKRIHPHAPCAADRSCSCRGPCKGGTATRHPSRRPRRCFHRNACTDSRRRTARAVVRIRCSSCACTPSSAGTGGSTPLARGRRCGFPCRRSRPRRGSKGWCMYPARPSARPCTPLGCAGEERAPPAPRTLLLPSRNRPRLLRHTPRSRVGRRPTYASYGASPRARSVAGTVPLLLLLLLCRW